MTQSTGQSHTGSSQSGKPPNPPLFFTPPYVICSFQVSKTHCIHKSFFLLVWYQWLLDIAELSRIKTIVKINVTIGLPQVHGGGPSQPAPLRVPALRRRAPELRGRTAGPAGGQDGPGERAAQVQPGGLR